MLNFYFKKEILNMNFGNFVFVHFKIRARGQRDN